MGSWVGATVGELVTVGGIGVGIAVDMGLGVCVGVTGGTRVTVAVGVAAGLSPHALRAPMMSKATSTLSPRVRSTIARVKNGLHSPCVDKVQGGHAEFSIPGSHDPISTHECNGVANRERPLLNCPGPFECRIQCQRMRQFPCGAKRHLGVGSH